MSFSRLSSLCRFWSLSRESGQTKPATIRHPGKVLRCGRHSPSYLDLRKGRGWKLLRLHQTHKRLVIHVPSFPGTHWIFQCSIVLKATKAGWGPRPGYIVCFWELERLSGVFLGNTLSRFIPSPPSKGMGMGLDWIQRILFAKHTPPLHTLGTSAP